ncbi:MAG: fliD [Cyanobacteria bacterium RYN_339]|nr:fliD [Cyanobacteria bacterium RYN_339]
MDALKLPGLATGLDTTSIISQLMAVERKPVNMLQSHQATAQSRLDAYRNINTKLMALQNAAKAAMGSSQNLSPFSSSTATSSNAAAFSATAANTASPGTYNVNVTNLATSQAAGGGAFNAGQGGGTLTISGPTGTANVTVAAGAGAQTIADAINADVNSGMNASVAGGRLLLTGKKTGAAENYAISMSAGPATLADLGLQPAGTDVAAVDAKLSVNGVNQTSSTNVFTSALSGVDITATGVGAGTVTIAKDATAAISAVKDMVAKFNDVVNTIKDYTKYDPTTKKGGILAGDSFVGDLQAKLTSMVTGAFDTRAYNASPANPGLRNYTDVGMNVQRDGTITLDTTKLSTAMTTYASATAGSASVYQLFSNEDGAMNGTTKVNNAGSAGVLGDGLANRLAAFADTMISPSSLYNSPNGTGRYNGALNERINGFTTSIKDFDTKIAQYNGRLDQYQTFLQNQFTNMEKVVNKLRSQGSYLAGQTGSSG